MSERVGGKWLSSQRKGMGEEVRARGEIGSRVKEYFNDLLSCIGRREVRCEKMTVLVEKCRR